MFGGRLPQRELRYASAKGSAFTVGEGPPHADTLTRWGEHEVTLAQPANC